MTLKVISGVNCHQFSVVECVASSCYNVIKRELGILISDIVTVDN